MLGELSLIKTQEVTLKWTRYFRINDITENVAPKIDS